MAVVEPFLDSQRITRMITTQRALILAIVLFLVALGLSGVRGEFWNEASQIATLPWGQLMLFDLYVGFAIFSLLIFRVEKRGLRRFLWTLSLFVLGNIVALVFLLVHLPSVQFQRTSKERS